jgi:hypothetical protein
VGPGVYLTMYGWISGWPALRASVVPYTFASVTEGNRVEKIQKNSGQDERAGPEVDPVPVVPRPVDVCHFVADQAGVGDGG